jgi:prepilin-type N-terminal cleavage/methylation domain-containing protein
MKQHISRPAFTLVELLVVIGIIAILLTLLVAAIQKVRTAASNLQCQNNLRQIGLALHHYRDVHKRFPPGYVDRNLNPSSDASFDQGPGWGWSALLLPYLDQQNLANRIDYRQTVGTTPVCQTVLPIFLCPADDELPTFQVYGTGVVVAQGNYIAVNGIKETSFYPGNNTGSFLRNRGMRIADITDGLSNTLFIGERNIAQSRTTWAGAVPGGLVTADQSPDPVGNAEFAQALVLGHGNRTHTPNNPGLWDADVFYSRHPQGVNFLVGDGSVRSIFYAIDGITYENLLSRSDGNAVGDY